MNVPIVEVRNLAVRLGEHWVLKGVDLAVERAQVLALVGGSGSGKTTLLQRIIGLARPEQGEVRLFGEPLFGGGVLRERALRRRFGVLFQHGALFSALNVHDNIAFPLRELKVFDEDFIHDLVLLKMHQVELLSRHAHLMPAELSGGMIKRVALARALVLEPELLLLDEPTAGLDPDRAASFVHLTRTLCRELGLTVVLVTHDLDTLLALASHVAVLAERRIVLCDTLEDVMRSEHLFVHNFFASSEARHARLAMGQATSVETV